MVLQSKFTGYTVGDEFNVVPVPARKYNNSINAKVIMDMVQENKISAQDIEICKVIFLFKQTTVDRLLLSFPDMNYNSLKARLDKLVDKCILNKFTYVTDDSDITANFPQGAFQFYCCDYGAICLLSNFSSYFFGDFIPPKVNMIAPDFAFNRLLITDFYNVIRSHTNPENFVGFEFSPVDFSIGNNRIGRVEFSMTITSKKADIVQNTVFVGDIIRESDLATTFAKKMRNLELIYNSNTQKKLYNIFNMSKSANSRDSEMPLYTILLCENQMVLERVLRFVAADKKISDNVRFAMFNESGMEDFKKSIFLKYNDNLKALARVKFSF